MRDSGAMYIKWAFEQMVASTSIGSFLLNVLTLSLNSNLVKLNVLVRNVNRFAIVNANMGRNNSKLPNPSSLTVFHT